MPHYVACMFIVIKSVRWDNNYMTRSHTYIHTCEPGGGGVSYVRARSLYDAAQRTGRNVFGSWTFDTHPRVGTYFLTLANLSLLRTFGMLPSASRTTAAVTSRSCCCVYDMHRKNCVSSRCSTADVERVVQDEKPVTAQHQSNS